jgi:sugar lactone lactonase YvrE
MNIKASFIIILLLFQWAAIAASSQAVLVHNTMEEINAREGKLHLKLIRVWGGAEEEDENKFFKTPKAIAVSANKQVYICDQHSHHIKVFDFAGKYLRTIGGKGRGPGDLYGPYNIAFSPDGDLVVNEAGGRRIQWLTPEGKSIRVLKNIFFANWMAVTSKNEPVVYNHKKTFEARKLVSIYDKKGNTVKEIGVYHDQSKSFFNSEKLRFSIDGSDNIYAANKGTPVIRKYSPEGKLIMAVTFDAPFGIPVRISLNPAKDEIENAAEREESPVEIRRSKKGVSIQLGNPKGKDWPMIGICTGMAIDSKERIYIVTLKRKLTDSEMMGTAISGGITGEVDRKRLNFDIVENIDVNRLLVFNPEGRIIAEAAMTTFCDDLYIFADRIFIVDGLCNQRILEYEMSFMN